MGADAKLRQVAVAQTLEVGAGAHALSGSHEWGLKPTALILHVGGCSPIRVDFRQ